MYAIRSYYGHDSDTPDVTLVNDAPTIDVVANDFTEDAAATKAGAVAGTYTYGDEDTAMSDLAVSFTVGTNADGYYVLGTGADAGRNNFV